MRNLTQMPQTFKIYLMRTAGYTLIVWVISMLLAMFGISIFGPQSPLLLTLHGLFSSLIVFLLVVWVLFLAPLSLLYGISTVKPDAPQQWTLRDTLLVGFFIAAGIFILSRGMLVGVLPFIVAILYTITGLKHTNKPHVKMRTGLRAGSYYAALGLAPLIIICAELSRFAELSASCDACGDAYLFLIYAIPVQLILCAIIFATGYVVGHFRAVDL